MLSADQAALLVRATARLSAAIFVANLIVAGNRVGARRPGALRSADVATFAAFIVSHTIHFACVALLAVATGGENVRKSGGWIAVSIVAALFYLACFSLLRLKRRPTAGWAARGERRREIAWVVPIWLVFFQAYALYAARSWVFVPLAALLLYSVARFVTQALRFGLRYP